MDTIYTNDPAVVAIAQKCFPEYNGRKFRLEITERNIPLKSYWDEGSRTDYRLYRFSTGDIATIPENGSAFIPDIKLPEGISVPCDDTAVVAHIISCGRDMGITISIHPSNAAKLIKDDQPKLTWEERVVLSSTRSYKNSYAGDSNVRLHEAQRQTKITEQAWNIAKVSLTEKKMINKAGAITNEGRNAIGWTDLYTLKVEKEQ